jgi:hypothetical protein
MQKLKVIVAGSRNFNDYGLLKSKLDFYFQRYSPNQITIISGTAKGADQLGERYAREKGITVKKYPANWSLGKIAGYLRNVEMAKNATHCVCFWDGESRGTKMMIEIAKERKLELRVVKKLITDLLCKISD